MSGIKSEKAVAHILSSCPHPKTDDKETFELLVTVVSIAEQEAEERNGQQLKQLIDRAVEAFCSVCEHKEWCNRAEMVKCDHIESFKQQLTEKQ